MINNKKLKVSKNQFAEVLYYWLSGYLTKEAIEKSAKRFGFKIRNNKDFSKIFEELFVLNMWLIVYTCEGVFENEDNRNECLDIFHHLAYDRHIENKENTFNDWRMLISSRYVEYGKAMEMKHTSTPLWVVVDIVNKRLSGAVNKDLSFQMKMVGYLGLYVKHLGKAIKQYTIE